MENQEKQLCYLHELPDYKIEDGYADIRGWEVKDAALRTIGKVKNLIINKIREKVVYLDIEVDQSIINAKHDPYGRPANIEIHEFINEDGENHIIVPIGMVDINIDKKYVFTESIDHETFAETKRMRPGSTIGRDYENIVMNSYQRANFTEGGTDNMETDIDAEKERLEKIKKRERIGEYRDDMERENRRVDWYDAENEGLKSREELERERDFLERERDFYERSEFDDSRFKRERKG